MCSNIKIKADIKNLFYKKLDPSQISMPSKIQISSLHLQCARRKFEICTLLNKINCYFIKNSNHIDMASFSICLTTMASCSTCPSFVNINQTHMYIVISVQYNGRPSAIFRAKPPIDRPIEPLISHFGRPTFFSVEYHNCSVYYR